MKKQAMIFGVVTMISMIVATLGHTYNPAICVAIKPMSWPFIALLVMAGRQLVKAYRKEK